MQYSKGFNLIELMVVVAIIAILAAIAVPSYIGYIARSANSACLGEAKGFMSEMIVSINRGESLPIFTASDYRSCSRITIAADERSVTAFPVEPGDTGVLCDIDASTSCSLDETVLVIP